MNYRVRLYLNRGEGPEWLRLLALVCWVRGGVVKPEAFGRANLAAGDGQCRWKDGRAAGFAD